MDPDRSGVQFWVERLGHQDVINRCESPLTCVEAIYNRTDGLRPFVAGKTAFHQGIAKFSGYEDVEEGI